MRNVTTTIAPPPSAAAVTTSPVAGGPGRRAEEALQHQAFHDHLTSLPNRAAFNERIITMAQGRDLARVHCDADGALGRSFFDVFAERLLAARLHHLRLQSASPNQYDLGARGNPSGARKEQTQRNRFSCFEVAPQIEHKTIAARR
jgi:hypothetical protein